MCRHQDTYGEFVTAADLERKVRQHDNDIAAVYSLISDIQTTQSQHTNRFDELTEDVASLGTRLGSVGSQMTSLEGTVDRLDTTVDSLDTKVGQLDTKVDSLDTKVDSLDTKFNELQGTVNQVLDLLQRDRDA